MGWQGVGRAWVVQRQLVCAAGIEYVVGVAVVVAAVAAAVVVVRNWGRGWYGDEVEEAEEELPTRVEAAAWARPNVAACWMSADAGPGGG